jgi:uncharacterized membrane protein YraQ (UPF0718 family)
MADDVTLKQLPRRSVIMTGGLALFVLAALLLWPGFVLGALRFTFASLFEVLPLVVPGILLAAWIIASGADQRVAQAFGGHQATAVIVASAVGAITPVCGVTVLPVMAGLLAARVPLAPVMAFWLASPITDPAMLATTAATLGYPFALGKTLAAFGLGLWGGSVTASLAARDWAKAPLRERFAVDPTKSPACGEVGSFSPLVWRDGTRRRRFLQQAGATSRLIMICLIPAFAAEFALNALLRPEALTPYIGDDVWWAIPFAVFVGAPAYLDGYAALPLTRGLIDHGMSQGAAMAFLVSGGVVSVWGALAILPVLRLRPFLLYLALALSGSLFAGYLFELTV